MIAPEPFNSGSSSEFVQLDVAQEINSCEECETRILKSNVTPATGASASKCKTSPFSFVIVSVCCESRRVSV
jgi:hypothetical protein